MKGENENKGKNKKSYHSQSSLRMFKLNPDLYKEIYIGNKTNRVGIKSYAKKNKNNKKIEKGIKFHILAERYFNDMKDYFYIKDKELLKWMKVLEEHYPMGLAENREFRSEYEIKQDKDNLKLLVKYDLLIIDKEQQEIVIIDFKTNKERYNIEILEEDIQTLVYLYVLKENLENLNLKTKNIKMQYFQLNYPKESIEIEYNEEKYEKNKKILEKMLKDIEKIKQI